MPVVTCLYTVGNLGGGGECASCRFVILPQLVLRKVYIYIMQIIIISLKQSFSTRHSMILKDQNTRDHSAWTIENGDPMHEVCIPLGIPRAWKRQK